MKKRPFALTTIMNPKHSPRTFEEHQELLKVYQVIPWLILVNPLNPHVELSNDLMTQMNEQAKTPQGLQLYVICKRTGEVYVATVQKITPVWDIAAINMSDPKLCSYYQPAIKKLTPKYFLLISSLKPAHAYDLLSLTPVKGYDISPWTDNGTLLYPIPQRIIDAVTQPQVVCLSPEFLAGLEWPGLRMIFDNGHDVLLKNKAGLGQKKNYKELGFASGKGGACNKQWELLQHLAENQGHLELKYFGEGKGKFSRQIISTLRYELKRLFSVSNDPFLPFKKKLGFQLKFSIGYDDQTPKPQIPPAITNHLVATSQVPGCQSPPTRLQILSKNPAFDRDIFESYIEDVRRGGDNIKYRCDFLEKEKDNKKIEY